jgi:hypothetical protein
MYGRVWSKTHYIVCSIYGLATKELSSKLLLRSICYKIHASKNTLNNQYYTSTRCI